MTYSDIHAYTYYCNEPTVPEARFELEVGVATTDGSIDVLVPAIIDDKIDVLVLLPLTLSFSIRRVEVGTNSSNAKEL